jgi:aminopeptidase
MTNPVMQKWAEVLVRYSTNVEQGNTVAIQGGVLAEPLLRAVYREVVEQGAFPIMVPTFPDLGPDLLRLGSDDQLQFISPVEQFLRTEADVVVFVMADPNTRSSAGVDPARQATFQKARTELAKQFMARESTGEVEWALTLYPTAAYAQDAEMSNDAYADFVFRACKLHEDDPVAAWQRQAAEQQRVIDWLDGKRDVHLTGPGTDLRLSIEGRTWMNADGHKNFPDGEIFTAPIEDSIEGHITYSFPAIYAGREVTGVRLGFAGGKVVEATADKGEDLLLQLIDVDEGARRVGEFAIGTNFEISQFTRQILFDEKIGGTVHMALGLAYPATGGTNESAIHWDMICDLRQGGQVEVDGEPLLADGRLVV